MIPGRDNPSMTSSLHVKQARFAPVTVVLNPVRISAAHPGSNTLGIIRAQGADTVKFLQGQLTQDVALLGLSEARLAAWCSAKGRMLASFIVFKLTHDDIVLITSQSTLASTLKRLQMFVLRAQCKLTDASHDFVLQGLATIAAPAGSQNATNSGAVHAGSVWTVAKNGTDITVQLSPGHLASGLANAPSDALAGYPAGQTVSRALRLRPVDAAMALPTAASDTEQVLALAWWNYLEVTCGIAPITAAVADLYVPQMLNYESVGGVNFKKGCYPGQEVVARSQFRGTLKRRAYIVTSATEMRAGQEVFDSRDTEQPCGTVAYAAAIAAGLGNPQAAYAAIVSMQTSAVDSPRLYAVASADGLQAEATLQLQALPYPLLADI